MRIAFFGTGKMGFPMAERLVLAGHGVQVTVHRNPEPAHELQGMGATLWNTPESAVRSADCLISILPGDLQMEDLLLRPSLLEAMKPGTVLVEMSTASPRCMEAIGEVYGGRGLPVLDAPVSGGVKGAREGTLTVIAGGDKEVLETVRPILKVLAANIVHVGAVGSGKAVKAVNQLIVGSNAVIVSEALRLARHLGVDLERLYQVVSASTGASPIFSSKFMKMAKEDFAPNFTLALMKKDMRIGLEEGSDLPLPMANLAYQLYLLMGREHEQQDFSVVSSLFRKKDEPSDQ